MGKGNWPKLKGLLVSRLGGRRGGSERGWRVGAGRGVSGRGRRSEGGGIYKMVVVYGIYVWEFL